MRRLLATDAYFGAPQNANKEPYTTPLESELNHPRIHNVYLITLHTCLKLNEHDTQFATQ